MNFFSFVLLRPIFSAPFFLELVSRVGSLFLFFLPTESKVPPFPRIIKGAPFPLFFSPFLLVVKSGSFPSLFSLPDQGERFFVVVF